MFTSNVINLFIAFLFQFLCLKLAKIGNLKVP